jgi:pyrrolidone-carboxylate peptidase
MKFVILLSLFLTSFAWAKPLVLITYFDPFNKAAFNNSERVAKALEARLNTETSQIEIKLCGLNTIFDKAYAQTEDCLKALTDRPVMVIALGESTCQLKVETMMRNIDKTHGPDNAGVERNNSKITHGAPDVIGMRYPLPQMYCTLTTAERNNIDVSNNAGSFVCNNTAYQMSYHYPEIQYGFIHVPANTCSNLVKKTEASVVTLEKMILEGVRYLSNAEGSSDLPHSGNEIRLPTRKEEIKNLLRRYSDKNDCINEYLKKSKAVNEGRIFFGLMN